MRVSPLLFVLASVVVVTAACHHEDDEAKVPMRLSRTTDTAAANAPLKEGDIRITSVDSGVDLALIGDSISGGLSQKTLAKVRRDMGTNEVQGSEFGAQIEKMVKGTVQNALGTRVIFALSDVKDVRYDGKKLVFDWNGKPQEGFSKVNVDHKDVLESFSSDDAQRFVIAVRARKRALGRTS
ncbi:MAG: hypothetical protein ABI625_15845 [bacterium]